MKEAVDNDENNNNQDNNSENMYSYRGDNQNNQGSGAIRRSMGDMNPNKDNDNSQFEQSESNSEVNLNKFYWLPFTFLGGLEGIFILALSLLFEIEFTPHYLKVSYYNETNTKVRQINDKEIFAEKEKYLNYGQFRDLNIMAFIGFGLIHSILKKNAWTSISINILLMAIAFQIAIFFNFLWEMAFNEYWNGKQMDFAFINEAIYISCTVSITLGSVIGKLSTMQYILMPIFEIILATMNFQLGEKKLQTVDTGGALYLHLFASIFALSINIVLFYSSSTRDKIQRYEHLNGANYFSNITTFLGLLILFAFFPNFNSTLCLEQENRNRARINTYFSLFGSVIGSLVTSGLLNQGKVVLEQIMYGILSGGIIISGCCSVCFYQWAALILGTLGSAIAVVLLSKIKPFIIRWGFLDCCNVVLIHGIFGILGGFITPMFIRGVKKDDKTNFKLFRDNRRSNARQAGIQVAELFITIGISFIGGIATGFLMKISTCNEINVFFHDSEFFKDFNDNSEIDQIEDDKESKPSYL